MSDFTLLLFGGSVPWGFPYAPKCDIGSIVSQAWSGSVADTELVVHNEAQYGAPSRYVLERVRSVARRSDLGGRSVALVYSGNNEFIHLAPGRDSRGTGPALVGEVERAAIVENHRQNLEASALALRRAGVEVVLSTIPTNLRDWPPSYTVLPAEEDGRGRAITDLLARARAMIQAARADEVEATLDELLRLDPACAQAHFALGRLHLARGRAADARVHLVRANDCDGRPIRATTAINANIRALAAEHGLRLLDAEAIFDSTAPEPVCGNAQFWDDCHPKLAGYVALAGRVSDEIAQFVGTTAPPMPSLDEVRRAHDLDESFEADLHWRVGLYCYKHADCWDAELPLDLGERYIRHALSLAPDRVETQIAFALLLACRGDEAGAREVVRTAHTIDPQRALWLLHGREAKTTLGSIGVTDVEQWAFSEDC